tara:strand:- start:1353 stop:1850 length:498 start_codon:yes stop_codon:yes gene_type:complete
MHLRFSVDELPVSVNELYFKKGKRHVLTPAGRRYKTRFLGNSGNCPIELLMKWRAEPSDRFVLRIWLRMKRDRLINDRFGIDRRIKYQYKTVDASNMIKLVEDAISELTGINDRSNWIVLVQKMETENEGVDAMLYQAENEPMMTEDIDDAIRAYESRLAQYRDD